MCGLAGYSGSGTNTQDILALLVFAQTRGMDSVGIYSENGLEKAVSAPTSFIVSKIDDVKQIADGAALVMAHSRASTMGGITVANAHPFRFQNYSRSDGNTYTKEVIGCHNGWLFPTYLDDMAEEHNIETPNIDSKLIYEILIENGMDFSCLKTIEGTMALSFVIDDVLHLYRRSSKPLFFGAKSHGIYYSSVEDGLIAIGCTNIAEVTTNIMYQFKGGKLIDTTYVEDARYVKNLPVDVSPSKWRDIAGKEASAHIPTTTLSSRRYAKKSNNSKFDYSANTVEATRTVKGTNEVVNLETLSAKMKAITIDETLPKNLVNQEIWDAKARDSFIIIKALDAVTGSPIEGQAFLSPAAEGEAITNEEGLAMLYFKTYRGDTRIYSGDPLSKKVMYSTLIGIKQGRVLEVTLKLPFRSKEEAAKENARGYIPTRIPFQMETGAQGQTSNIGSADIHEGSEERFLDTLTGSTDETDETRPSCGYEGSAKAMGSRFDKIEKKQELCDYFDVVPTIPDITLDLLDVKSRQLFEIDEEIAYHKSRIDVGGEVEDEVERECVVNTIIGLESDLRDVTEQLGTIMHKYNYTS